MIVEGVDHLAYLVEAIHKGSRRGLVGVADGHSDGIESLKTHILSEPEGGSSCDADCLGRPPLSSVRQSLKASHEKVAPEVQIELLEVNVLLLQVLVGGWDEHLLHPLLREAYPEQLKIIHLTNFRPRIVFPSPSAFCN